MGKLKIYSYPENPRVWKSLVAANYAGVEVEVCSNFEFGKDNKTEEFLSCKNLMGKVPVLETPEGCLSESNSMARYVARQSSSYPLYGEGVFEASSIDRWLDFVLTEIEPSALVWLGPVLGFVAFNKQQHDKAVATLTRTLEALNKHFLMNTFLVGERITLADIVMATSLAPLFRMVFDKEFRKPFGNVQRWFVTCVEQPQFALCGMKRESLCEKAMQPDFKKLAQLNQGEKKEKKEKKEKPAQQPKKEKKEEKKEKEEEEVAAPPPPKKEKAKNPLDLLPPSDLDLEEWKRVYSNTTDFRGEAMKWFWEKYDAEGYSLWLATYKYPEELNKVFMTMNLIGGWFQRCDNLHKYAFGAATVVGESKNHNIEAAWLFRGTDMPQEMKENDDAECYNWTKVDRANEAQVALLADIWEHADDGKVNGKEIQDWNTFK